nr:GDSL esterase/lipase At1g71250 [Tanacetum cinerariifolium]GEY13613.1 GDSL esterase/lipase At1g71250 [Tanacetum cinerariifolium]
MAKEKDIQEKLLPALGFGTNDYINNYLMQHTYVSSQTYTPEAFSSLLLNHYSRQLKVDRPSPSHNKLFRSTGMMRKQSPEVPFLLAVQERNTGNNISLIFESECSTELTSGFSIHYTMFLMIGVKGP